MTQHDKIKQHNTGLDRYTTILREMIATQETTHKPANHTTLASISTTTQYLSKIKINKQQKVL